MIKNFLLGTIIAIITFYLAGGIYKKLTTHANVTKLPCQEEVVVFERLYEKPLLQEIQKAVYEQAYDVSIEFQKSYYMPTKLFEYVHKDEIKQVVLQTLQTYKKTLHVKEESLHVKVLVYENDKLDPGKKTAKSKLYAGYLVFDFYEGKTLVYKVQIDFIQPHGEDIAKRIKCAIKSLMNYQGEVNG